MYNIIAIIVSFILPLIIIRKKIVKTKKIKDFIVDNKYELFIYFVLVIGFMTRLVGIVNCPTGLNQDEASAGYEAYSLFKYGIDRHGKSFPVHFISWGSGQNVLYSYIMIPFIAVLGLNELSVRLPMAIIGCISLILIYKFFNKYNKKLEFIALTFFAICPWHIMKSRWGLESNLFPDMVLMAVYMLIKGIQNNKMKFFYIGITILSLSVYSYGTSYMFLPFFMSAVLIYLLKIKKINIKHVIISIIISVIICFPMILFVIINTFDYNEIILGKITIPRLYENRYERLTTILNLNFIKDILFLLLQIDSSKYNYIPFFGIIYLISWPFTVIGAINCFKNKNVEKNIVNIWFIVSSFLLIVFNEININRMNILIMPLIIYTILGIYIIYNKKRNIINFICIIYILSFLMFIFTYINIESKFCFAKGLESPLQYTINTDKKIYIQSSYNQPYIYVLFYTKTPVKEYIDTVSYYRSNIGNEMIKSFSKYNFYIPEEIDNNAIYIVPKDYEYDYTKFNCKDFRSYMVLENK